MTDFDVAVRPPVDSDPDEGPAVPGSRSARPSRLARRSAPSEPTVLISAVSVVAILTAATSLGSLVQGGGWWFTAALYSAAGVAVAALLRRLRRGGLLSLSGGMLALLALTVVLYGQGTFWLGFVPTLDTVDQIAGIIQQAFAQIYLDTIPATSTPGLQLMIAAGVGVLAIAVEALVVGARLPLLAGIPLLLLTIVPRRVVVDDRGLVEVGVTTALFLTLLWLDRRRESGRLGAGVASATAAIAVIGALFLQAVLPPFSERVSSSSSLLPVFGQGGDPLVRLGAHLRQGADVVTLTYQTNSPESVYLRVVTIDDLNGQDWTPDDVGEADGGTNLADFPNPAGLAADVARKEVTTTVSDRFDRRQWLPVPYPATSIEALDGNWVWSADSLSVESERSTQPANEYVVNSLLISPTPEQLQNASTEVPDGFAKYLDLPDGFPQTIGDTAAQVTLDAATDYERAVALQAYFRSSDFSYDEEAPVQDGYDGDGMAVVEAFLSAKKGYCIHFASAMTAMARSLGIPARLAVGYQPGERQIGANNTFEVTSHDLHAWPEIFFPGVGWTRFEPTPSRGEAPDYSFGVSESPINPSASAATTAAGDRALREEGTSAAAGGTSTSATDAAYGWLLGLAILMAVLVPAVIRVGRRRIRIGFLDRGRAGPALDELADTASDLGAIESSQVTPRALGAILGVLLGEAPALNRLVEAVEHERFARPGSTSGIPSEMTQVSPGSPSARGPTGAEVDQLIARLRARSTRIERARAFLAPRSLFRVRGVGPAARR